MKGVLEYGLKTVVKSSEIYPESRTSLHKNNIKRVMGQFSRISIKIQTTGPEKAVLIQTYPQISTFQRFCMYSTPPTGMDSYLKFSTHFSESVCARPQNRSRYIHSILCSHFYKIQKKRIFIFFKKVVPSTVTSRDGHVIFVSEF